MNYKERIKSLRTYELITQETIANILGIKRSTDKEYELQNSIIPITHLNEISNYFNVSIDFIFGFTYIRNYPNFQKNINQKLFCKRFKEFRTKNKLTQNNLANKINCDRSTLSNYENGKKLITTALLFDICKNYNISADYLLGKINNC